MSALGRFIEQNSNGDWVFEIPDDYDLADLICQAERVFASSYQDPAKMGKDIRAYLSLRPMVDQYLKYRKQG